MEGFGNILGKRNILNREPKIENIYCIPQRQSRDISIGIEIGRTAGI
jgi:hypothetical protein